MTSTKKYLSNIVALERVFVPKLVKVSNFVHSSFIYDLKQNGLQSARNNLSLTPVPAELPKLLETVYKRAGLFGARLTYNDLRAYLRAGRKAAGFGRNERWIADVLTYLRLNILNFAASIFETVKADILRIVEKAVEEGKGIDQIVQELQETGIVAARARTIARTEIVRAANVGHSIGAQSFPYEVNKRWSAAKDHRTRHSHRTVNNHVTDEQGTFNVPVYRGDKPTGRVDQMQFPGDTTAHPSNTINCRCRVLYEPKTDGKGQLIPRSSIPATVIPLRTSPVHHLPNTGIAASAKSALIEGITVDVDRSE